MKKRQSNVPVFLIYAGIIHAIGLALLLPMLITLPGPGRDEAPESAAIDVEIIPATPLAGKIEPDGEETSALPSGNASAGEGAEAKPEGAGEGVAAVDAEAAPEETPAEAIAQDEDDAKGAGAEPKEKVEPRATKPTKPARAAAAKPAKKAVAARKPGGSAARRAGKKDARLPPSTAP